MAVIIGTRASVQKYFEHPAINQSTLKMLTGGLDSMMAQLAKRKKDKEEGKPEPDYFTLGSAVDLILTGEDGEYEEAYYVSNMDKVPSEIERQIVEQVFNQVADVTKEFSNWASEIVDAANTAGWQRNWKDETRYNKLVAKCSDYFQEMCEAGDRKIISQETNQKILNIVNSLRTNERTAKYFDRDLQEQAGSIDFYYQFPIFFTYPIDGVDVECKGLLDMCIVHKDENNVVTQVEPIDLKTMSGNTLDFQGNLKKHRYDMQAAWYSYALQQHFNIDETQVALFKFIVESTTSYGTPVVYQLSRETVVMGKHGLPAMFIGTAPNRQVKYKEEPGFISLLTDYVKYEADGFTTDKILVNNPGIIPLDWTNGIG